MTCQVGCMSHDDSIPGDVKSMMWSSLGNVSPGKKWMLKMNGQREEGHKRFINSLFERADMTISKQDWSSCSWMLHTPLSNSSNNFVLSDNRSDNINVLISITEENLQHLFLEAPIKIFHKKNICHTNLWWVALRSFYTHLLKLILALMGKVINQKQTLQTA